MKNALQKIVTTEVQKQFKTEGAFYENYLEMTRQSWGRWKRGERNFSHENIIKLSSLFTPYEWMLVNKIAKDMQMFPNNFKQSPIDVYNDSRKAIAKKWVKAGSSISVNAARNVDDPKDGRKTPGTEVIVKMEHDLPLINSDDSMRFYVKQSSGHIKAGKENRKKWFNKNIDELI